MTQKKEGAKNEKNEKFIGHQKIQGIVKSEHTTPRGSEIVEVVFVNGDKKLFPKKTLDGVVSDEAIDPTQLREKKIDIIANDVIEILKEYDLELSEFTSFSGNVHNKFLNFFNRANNFLWTNDDSKFIPGVDSMMGVTLLDSIRVLDKNTKNERPQQTKGDNGDSRE